MKRMNKISRAEVEALAALRESEYAYSRRVDRREDARSEEKKVNNCRHSLIRVHSIREEAMKREMQSPVQKYPDTIDNVIIYNSRIPSHTITDLRAVSRALSIAKRSGIASEYTPRCVLPPMLAGCLARLQNIPIHEHAVISLLVRWTLNTRPNASEVERAANKYGVARHADTLIRFAEQCWGA